MREIKPDQSSITMLQLSELRSVVNLTDAHDFIDKINLVVKPPFSREQILRIEKNCRVRIHKWWDGNRWHGPRLLRNGEQLLPIAQPNQKLYRTIAATRPDYRISQVEIARDLIFDDENDLAWTTQLVRDHSLKSNQRGMIRFHKTTSYTGPRRTANNFVTYADRHSKVTGEVHCLHIEWRLRRYALSDLGIKTFDDIQRLDLQQFWRQRRVHLYTIDDVGKLGRLYNNFWYGTHRRRPWIETCGRGRIQYHRDLRAGHQILRVLRSISNVVTFYRNRFRVRSCLTPLDVQRLRNSRATHYYDYMSIWHVVPFPLQFQKDVMRFRPENHEFRGAVR
jgi:hypothetical protein